MTLEYITVTAAAEVLKISPRTFYRLLNNDPNIPRYRVGERLRFTRESLIEYFQQKSSNQNANGGNDEELRKN